jgi:hypothetical protein
MHSPQRKPKNNLVKTKSSFVLRMIIHDRLAQVLANRTIDDSFLFFNIGTSFLWMDAKGKPKVNFIGCDDGPSHSSTTLGPTLKDCLYQSVSHLS